MCLGSKGQRTSIITFGDSQAEVLDYVFHGDSRYITNDQNPWCGWHSGWSCRGLGKEANKGRILGAVKQQLADPELDRCIVLLAFGSIDIEWNLPFRRDVKGEDPDTTQLVQEASAGVLMVVEELRKLRDEAAARNGPELKVVLVFPFAPMPLKWDYVHRVYAAEPPTYSTPPVAERLDLWKQFIVAMKAGAATAGWEVPVVDIVPVFEARGAEAFQNDTREDHHPDFIKTQGPLAEAICALGIEGIAPQPPLKELFPHVRRPLPKTLPPVPAPKAAPAAAPDKAEKAEKADAQKGGDAAAPAPTAGGAAPAGRKRAREGPSDGDAAPTLVPDDKRAMYAAGSA